MLLRHLFYFIVVAGYRGFTRVAAAFHVPRPVLSQQIHQLEAMLEIQLFNRSGRYTRLTDAGEIWLEYARRVLRDLEEGWRALHDARDLQRGKLRIAMAPTFTTYMLGPLVEAYYRRYPGAKLLIQEMNQGRTGTMLLEDELDVGTAFGESLSRDIVVQPLLTETLVLVVSCVHSLVHENHLQLQALDAQPPIPLSSESATREQINRHYRRHRFESDVRMEVDSIGAVLTIIRGTPSATLLLTAIAGQYSDLVAIELKPALLQRTVCSLQCQGVRQSTAAREFIVLAREIAVTPERENNQAPYEDLCHLPTSLD